MIKIIKFLEKMWLVLAILTFAIGLYWTFQNSTYDALFFFGFSAFSVFLFMMRRKQRRFHEKNKKRETGNQKS